MEPDKKYVNSEKTFNIMQIKNELDIHYKTIDQERLELYNLTVSSLQWNKNDKQFLADNNRPAFAYNLIAKYLRALSGTERQNRRKLQVVGRTPDDHQMAEVFNKLLDWLLEKNNFDYLQSKTFLDALIGRWGWLKVGWSTRLDPGGIVSIERVNPFMIKPDFNFSDGTLNTCQYLLHTQWLTIEDIIRDYAADDEDLAWTLIEMDKTITMADPTKRKNIISTIWQKVWGSLSERILGGGTAETTTVSTLVDRAEQYYDSVTGRYCVPELHQRVTLNRMIMKHPETGDEIDISKKVLDDTKKYGYDSEKLILIQQQHPEYVFGKTRKETIQVTTALPVFDMILDDKPYPIDTNKFLFHPVFCYDFHTDLSLTQSVVDELKDPQLSFNKRKSTILELVSRTASSGWTYEEGAIDAEADEWTNRKIGGLKPVKKGFFDRIKADTPPSIPQGLFQYAMEDREIMQEITVPLASVGRSESAQETATAFMGKRQQGDIMQLITSDNQLLQSQGLLTNVVALIQKYMTDERVIRITDNPKKPEYLVLNQYDPVSQNKINDVSTAKFDLIVDPMPRGELEKERQFLMLRELYNEIKVVNPAAAMAVLPVVIKNSGSVYADEILDAMQMSAQQMQQSMLPPELAVDPQQMPTAPPPMPIEAMQLSPEEAAMAALTEQHKP